MLCDSPRHSSAAMCQNSILMPHHHRQKKNSQTNMQQLSYNTKPSSNAKQCTAHQTNTVHSIQTESYINFQQSTAMSYRLMLMLHAYIGMSRCRYISRVSFRLLPIIIFYKPHDPASAWAHLLPPELAPFAGDGGV